MEQDRKPIRQIPQVASILVLASVCILSNIAFIMYQRGAFHFWKSLSSPPSPAIQIINANPDSIWVKSTDGNIYTATVRNIFTAPVPCVSGEPCPRWILMKDASEVHPPFAEYTARETSCEKFDGQFPRNPSGTVIECIKTLLPSMPDGGGSDSYFALMSDGTIKYWVIYNGFYLTPLIFAGIASLVCPTTALLVATILYPRFHARAS